MKAPTAVRWHKPVCKFSVKTVHRWSLRVGKRGELLVPGQKFMVILYELQMDRQKSCEIAVSRYVMEADCSSNHTSCVMDNA